MINEKCSLNYTDMLGTLGIVSTGTLNYHLKILGELLTKNEAGQYTLTEKGKLASRFLLEFPEEDTQLQVKKKWWWRFWIAAIMLQSAGLAVVLVLHLLGYVDLAGVVRGLFAFVLGIVFLYFFYRMIRPPNQRTLQRNPTRTVENIFVAGRNLNEVNEEVLRWINDEGISIDVERYDLVRGRLGIPSGLGLTAPKYFEVSLKPEQTGVMVHTEGWISLYDVSERSFSKSALVVGGIPRKKGWKVIAQLWERLRMMSK